MLSIFKLILVYNLFTCVAPVTVILYFPCSLCNACIFAYLYFVYVLCINIICSACILGTGDRREKIKKYACIVQDEPLLEHCGMFPFQQACTVTVTTNNVSTA